MGIGCARVKHYIFDSSSLIRLGGFASDVMKEYQENCPITKPVGEYEDRVALYESYHHLNHYSMFGGRYKAGATNILEGLNRRYGNPAG